MGSTASWALGHRGDDGVTCSRWMTALQGQQHHGLRNGMGLRASWARGGRWCCGLGNGVGLMASLAWGQHLRGQQLGSGKIVAQTGGSTVVRNDNVEAPRRTR
jgi:hypothetical protein